MGRWLNGKKDGKGRSYDKNGKLAVEGDVDRRREKVKFMVMKNEDGSILCYEDFSKEEERLVETNAAVMRHFDRNWGWWSL